MIRKTFLPTAGVAAGVTALTLALTAPASADLTTRCVGEGGAVTVPGDLVVPAGRTCSLEGTVVEGNVRVGRDADLIVVDGTFRGNVRVLANAYLDATDTDVAGRVVARDAYGTYLDGTSLGDHLINRLDADSEYPGFVLAADVTAAADLRVLGGELFVEDSDVAGGVIARGSLYADLYRTFVDGGLRSVRNELGSVVCDVAIQGDSRITGNSFGVQLGGDGPLDECTAGSYWGGTVEVLNNSDGVAIDDNIVNGDLVLNNNDPIALLGDGNLVRGDVIGDFGSLDDAPAAALAAPNARAATPQAADRGEALEDLVDARRGVATKEAAAAGDAF